MSFNDDLMRAEAIREVRASGCTMPGVAELIVEHHGATHILANLSRIQALGEEVAASDTELGAKMRALLQQTAKEAEATEKKVVEIPSSTSSGSQPAVGTGTDAGAGSVSNAAAASGAPDTAAGTSAPSSAGAPAENSAAQGEGTAQGS